MCFSDNPPVIPGVFLVENPHMKAESMTLHTGDGRKVEGDLTLGHWIQLPSPRKDGPMSVEKSLNERRSVRQYRPNEPLQLEEISQLLWSAQGTTSDEGLRTAPSAGALFPLEIYLVAGNVRNLHVGVYHYDPRRHAVLRVQLEDVRCDLRRSAADQAQILEAPAIVVVAALYDRMMTKYRERGRRYADFEAGHVSQNIYLQATALGLGTVAIGAFQGSDVRRVLGISEEHLYLMPVGKR